MVLFLQMTLTILKKKILVTIYNSDYVKFDPDYIEKRPISNAYFIQRICENKKLNYLDYD